MNLECLSIGQMARLNHISEQTLRLYDKMNLFTPIGVNPDNGYRYYSIGQSAKLDLIKYYQKLGFPLKDIQNSLMDSDSDSVTEQLSLKYEQLSKEIENLNECREAILQTLDNYNYYKSLPPDSICFRENLPERSIIVYDTRENLYDYDYNHYEYNLRRFRNYLTEHGYDAPIFENTGTIIRRQDLASAHLKSTEFFIATNKSTDHFPKTELIPKGTYLSLCCSDFDKETAYANLLLHEAAKMNMSIISDYYCETLSETPQSSDRGHGLRYKIMVRIA